MSDDDRVAVQLPGGITGTVAKDDPTIPKGTRVLSPQEHAAAQAQVAVQEKPVTVGEAAKGAGEAWLAGAHASTAGAFEALGVPVDKALPRSAQDYLNDINEKHPIVSGWMGAMGQARGAIGAGEVTGGSAAAGRLGIVGHALQGGVENVLASSAHDVNEASLGNHDVNGEALYADLPKRFIEGGAVGGLFGAAGRVLEKGVPALTARAVPALEEGASAALGRDVGEAGDAAVAAGARIRGFAGGEVPGTESEVARLLDRERLSQQGAQRAAYEGSVSDLTSAHAAERAVLTGRQEAGLAETLARGQEGVETAERDAGHADLGARFRAEADTDAAAVAGRESVMGAKLEANAAAREHGAASRRISEVTDIAERSVKELDRVRLHHLSVEAALAEERSAAEEALRGLREERAQVLGEPAPAEHGLQSMEDVKVDADGMRPESINVVRKERASGKAMRPVEVSLYPEEKPVLTDGRHRLAVAQERGDSHIEALIRRYDKEGANIATPERVKLPIYSHKTAHEFASTRARSAGVTGGVTAHPEYTRAMAELGHPLGPQPETVLGETGSPSAATHASRVQETQAQIQKAIQEAEGHLETVKAAQVDAKRTAQKELPLALRDADRKVAEFRRAREAEAKLAGRKAEAALARVPEVEARVTRDVAKAKASGEVAHAKAQKEGAAQIARAKLEAEGMRQEFERGALKEKTALEKAHEKARAAVAEPSGETDVDPLIAGLKARQKANAESHLVSPFAAQGALWSVVRGHPLGAASDLLGSFVAGRLRAHGNLLTARALRGVSVRLSALDVAVKNGAASLFAGTGQRVTNAAARAAPAPRQELKTPDFDDVATQVRAARANPGLVEEHLKAQMGKDVADQAPQTFAAALATALRAQQFLQSILPPEQIDSHSLTPLLEHEPISETSQDTFLQAAGAINKPIELFRLAKSGDLTEEQVAAVQAVYPNLYPKMQDEIRTQLSMVKKEIPYERQMQIGLLLGQPTDEVQDPQFQATMRASYQNKAQQGAPLGSKASGPQQSKTTDSMRSASESVEKGEP